MLHPRALGVIPLHPHHSKSRESIKSARSRIAGSFHAAFIFIGDGATQGIW